MRRDHWRRELLLGVWLLASLGHANAQVVFTDNFDAGEMDPHWIPVPEVGFSVGVSGGVLQFDKAAGVTTGFQVVLSCFKVTGDFVATGSFNRSSTAFASFGIGVQTEPPDIVGYADIYFVAGDRIWANIFIPPGFGQVFQYNYAASSQLRIQRTGDTLLLQYDTGAGFVTLHGATHPNLAAPVIVDLFLGEEMASSVASTGLLDDLYITADALAGCDLDGDGSEVGTDCDDVDACTYVGAPEICDGKDNDCDLSTDEGPLVAPGPTTGLRFSSDAVSLAWMACGASTYDVIKGDLAVLHATGGSFTDSVLGCLENDSLDPQSSDPSLPPLSGAFYYLVRANGPCGDGTYDSGSPSQVGLRDAPIDASPLACP